MCLFLVFCFWAYVVVKKKEMYIFMLLCLEKDAWENVLLAYMMLVYTWGYGKYQIAFLSFMRLWCSFCHKTMK